MKITQLILKVLAVTVFVVYNFRLFMNDYFIWIINGGRYGELYYEAKDVLQTITRWATTITICLIPTAAFFKSKTLARMTVVFTIASLVLNFIGFDKTIYYFLKYSERGLQLNPGFRKFEFVFELVTISIYLVLFIFINNKSLIFASWKEVLRFVIYTPFVTLIAMPVYAPQSLIGFTQIRMDYFTAPHIIWIAMIFATFFILSALYRHDSLNHREIILCFLTLFLFQHYNSIYLMDLNASRLPFQLCNLGAYFMVILFLFRKSKKMQAFFDFSMIANVPGALIAIIAVDVNRGIGSFWNIHYYLEHTWVFILPLLYFVYGIYKFPKEHSFKHFIVGFTAYFVSCAVLGILFNCFLYKEGDPFFCNVNYFYLFNTLVMELFTFASFTRVWAVVWNGYAFYPLYMLFIYFGFIIICFVSYVVYEKFYETGKQHAELHRLKVELKKEKNNA